MLTILHDDNASVAVSKDISNSDIKNKPPSPHPVGWTPRTIFKEGESHLGNKSTPKQVKLDQQKGEPYTC